MLSVQPEDMTTPIDFRTGKNTWGHSLHASTFSAPIFPYPWDKSTRRYTFLCHTSQFPNLERKVLWSGCYGDVEGVIVDYRNLGNPKDMWEVTVQIGMPGPQPLKSRLLEALYRLSAKLTGANTPPR